MKKVLIEFGGAIILYLVIFFGVIAITSRINNINSDNYSVTVNK